MCAAKADGLKEDQGNDETDRAPDEEADHYRRREPHDAIGEHFEVERWVDDDGYSNDDEIAEQGVDDSSGEPRSETGTGGVVVGPLLSEAHPGADERGNECGRGEKDGDRRGRLELQLAKEDEGQNSDKGQRQEH